MALKSQPLTVQYVAWNTTTNQPAVGDSANHAITCVGDGASFRPGGSTPTSPAEISSAAIPGVYKIALAGSEMAYNLVTVGGKSSTSGVVLIPVTLATERGVLPVVAPATAGGLPTVDGSNGVKLSVGVGAGQVNASSGKVPATLAAGDSADAATIRSTIGVAGAGLTALGDSRLGYLDAAISSRSTFAGGVVAGVANPVTVGTVNDKAGYALAAAGLDSVQVESGINARQALSPILAASAGVVSGASTGVILIKGGNSSTTRISAVTDNAGNRSSVTLTLPS